MVYHDASFCGACGTNLRQLEKTGQWALHHGRRHQTTGQIRADLDQMFQYKVRGDIMGFLHEPGNITHHFPLHAGDNTIGSGAQNDIVVDLPTISWTHALLICRPQRVLVQDSASTNGTYVNSVSVLRATPLHHGDLLRLADAEFAVWLRPDMRTS